MKRRFPEILLNAERKLFMVVGREFHKTEEIAEKMQFCAHIFPYIIENRENRQGFLYKWKIMGL